MATPTQVKRRGRLSLILGALIAAAALAAVAYADDIANNLDASVDSVAEVMALNAGGADGTTQLYVVPRNGDGKNGCNLTGSTTLGVSISSSNTSFATVSPSSFTFTSCGDVANLTVTPHNAGSATITVAQTSNDTGATFNFATATFTVNVAPPPNTAPSVTVTGVTGGASYNKGSVPPAGCSVTDTEDGPSSFAATLSAVTGPYASDGIGEQTASCSYTDAGGLTASASVTYGIVDPTAPGIAYDITGTLGNNNWYTSNVGLSWTVTENESPSSLVKTGCANASITADQGPTDYSCAASSAGGSSAPVTVSIKRDAHPPTVTGSPATSPNGAGWYNGDVTINWTCADVGPSGLADSCPATTTISGEGRSLTDSLGPIHDNAGNGTTGVSAPAVNIDRTAPNVTASTAATGYTVGSATWYKDSVTFNWNASDPSLADNSAGSGISSGPTPATSTFATTGAGQSASSQATDNAGNTGTGHLTGVNVDASNPELGACPAGGPFTLGSGSHAVGPITVTDTGSGVDAGASTLSGSVDASSVGEKTVNFTAYDNVGHSAAKVCKYYVQYTFNGFFAPVDKPNTLNVSKAGQAIPLKWRLTDALGNPVLTLSAASVVVGSLACDASLPADLVEEYAAAASGLQNLGDGYYQFNWKTPTGYASSCKSIGLNLGEGFIRYNLANFNFKK